MNVRRWLTPGIGVKRWLLVVFLGLLLLAVGFAHFLRQASRDLEPGGPLGTVIDVVTLQFLPFPFRGFIVGAVGLALVVLGAFYYGYSKHAGAGLAELLLAWALPNSLLGGLFSALARAKVLTILVVIVASPIISLIPSIGAGRVAGLCEAWLRRPTEADCERVPDDVLSIKGVYRNRFTRVLLVAIASTLGSLLGAWVGAGWVVSLL